VKGWNGWLGWLGWGVDGGAPAQPASDGPWRRLTGEYPKARPRPVVVVVPPELPLPPPAPTQPAPIVVMVSGESVFREQLLGALTVPVPRGTERGRDEAELAIALLLAA
jgi:hypothetical protein